jgi:hypothetical protein
LKKADEYAAFNDLAKKLMSVPHREVKAKLDAEQQAKKQKKAKKSSASREAT